MDLMQKITSLCQRRGFIFPSAETYGGLVSSWDYGPLGTKMIMTIKDLWRKDFILHRDDIVEIESSIIMSPKVWEASGHLKHFHDPLVECKECHERYRADHLSQEDRKCPNCGAQDFTKPKDFNLMFKTFVGSVEQTARQTYLRPETAQGIFVNFKNILNTTRRKIPFGIAQIGKAFRNEVTPGNFIFRTMEFEQMELEYFVKPGKDEKWFEYWRKYCLDFVLSLGAKKKNLRFYDHPKSDLSHYSKATTDIEYKFPWGWGELWGIANRTDYDLKQHSKHSGKDLSYRDQISSKNFFPYVIEPSVGANRLLLAILVDAYTEEQAPTAKGELSSADGKTETRVVMKFKKELAPVQVAVLPLSKKENLSKLARGIYDMLKTKFICEYDETQSIGKRYRRQDEIGTPCCVTVDFESLKDKKVTVRDRDTMKQERVQIAEISKSLRLKFCF